MIRGYLDRLKKYRKILPTLFNFLDLDGCSIVMECRGIASLSLGLLVLWKYLYLMELAWRYCFHKWLSKFVFSKISSTNWYQANFSFKARPLRIRIEVIIGLDNNLLGFILTTCFGDEYNFLNSHCKDPFIVVLNMFWRPKWFSKRSWSSGFWSDTRAWRQESWVSSLIIYPLEICWSSFEFLQLVIEIKGLQVSTKNFISTEPS